MLSVSSQFSMNIEIESYWELLALHKSLMAVKFDKNSCLREAQGSPFTGSLAFKVFNQLVASSKEQQATDWLKWQEADDSRIETQLLRKHIKESEWWAGSDHSNKEKYVRDFMAPLILNEQVFNDIIKNC
jgi:hypothetical protein